MTNVKNWFGDAFAELHPLLQQLHVSGGNLFGKVNLSFGRGLGGVLGRRIAKKMGIPSQPGNIDFDVEIAHTNDALIWSRTFNHETKMTSHFVPLGSYPDGVFIERTGGIKLLLGVEIRQGGWYWRQKAVYLGKLRVPLFLFPRAIAYKKIENERYQFKVSLSYPFLGKLLEYEGSLEARSKD